MIKINGVHLHGVLHRGVLLQKDHHDVLYYDRHDDCHGDLHDGGYSALELHDELVDDKLVGTHHDEEEDSGLEEVHITTYVEHSLDFTSSLVVAITSHIEVRSILVVGYETSIFSFYLIIQLMVNYQYLYVIKLNP
jgi:hypothetical protein